ncbi:MAG: glucose-1-phosphate adenylyltransferase [Candidatus Binatia bacterium]
MNNVVAVILGGGRGTRLYPLTQLRSKPAVPLVGKYRLVDIPISNCINSGLRNIFVLSQFQSASLNRHVSRTYRFDPFSSGFVEILAAEQTEESTDWYQGTADAVRKQLRRFLSRGAECILVLSGDQLYVMDFRKILAVHIASRADITVAATPVPEAEVFEFGILQIDAAGTVTDFAEKPRDTSVLGRLALSERMLDAHGVAHDRRYLASMGIYAFRPEVLIQVLEDPMQIDFGKEVIPRAISTHRVHSHFFTGYWEDIGTIRTFFAANVDLASDKPPIDLFSEEAPIYTRPRFLPPSNLRATRVHESIVCEGCRIGEAEIDRSVVGIRSVIGDGVRLSHTIMMGADYYGESRTEADKDRSVPVGVGAGSVIERAIIDKNAHIGEGVVIRPQQRVQNFDGPGYNIRDGIVIIPKNGVIRSGTVI